MKMEFKTKTRNTSVAILRRNYQNKKSGNVTASKKEIQDRFDNLDWKDQKKILLDFLQSGKTDRAWASRQLIKYWDPCFEPIVKELWETLQEKWLTWSIIRFFPKEYLKRNIESLSEDRNYYFLCLRLSDDEDFHIDESKMNEIDCLNIMIKSGRSVTDEYLIHKFFSLVSKLCTGDYDWNPNAKWPTTYFSNEIPSVMKIQMIQTAIRKIEYLCKNDLDLYFFFCDWNREVHRDIENSEDFRVLQSLPFSQENIESRKQAIAKQYCYHHLDNQYKFKGDNPDFQYPLQYYQPYEKKIGNSLEDDVLPF